MDIDAAFIHCVENRSPGCLGVTLVGHLSRTWYEDRQTLVDLLEPLQLEDQEMFVSIHGAFGFDLMIEETAHLMGIRIRSNAKDWGTIRKERFGYRTVDAHDLFTGTVAVVVMTRRKLPKDVWEVDPPVIDSAVQHGMPVFALNEEGVLWPWLLR